MTTGKSKMDASVDDGQTLSALWEAVISGDTKVTRRLLRSGADPNDQHPYREDSFTPLKELAYHRGGDVDVARELIKHGADVNPLGEESPLQLAVQNGNFRLAQLLLDNGARIDDPVTLLALAVASQDHAKETVSMLARYMDLNVLDVNGNNPLHWLSDSNLETAPEIAEVLLNAGVSLDHSGYQCYTPLLQAVWTNKPDLVALFLKHGANIHQTTYRGQTALHLACMYHRERTVRLLLEHGADANALDNFGSTPMSMMNIEILPAVEVMAEHLAKLKSGRVPVRQENLALIKKHPNLYNFYKDCRKKFKATRRVRLYFYLVLFLVLLFCLVVLGCYLLDMIYGTGYLVTLVALNLQSLANVFSNLTRQS